MNICPLMHEMPIMPDYEAVWRPDGSCSYCGSMHPDTFMARLEAGTIELGVTTKDYKVYVHPTPGSEAAPIKFYFQHLSVDQRHRFLTLLQEKRLKFKEGFFFEVLPFFIGVKSA